MVNLFETKMTKGKSVVVVTVVEGLARIIATRRVRWWRPGKRVAT